MSSKFIVPAILLNRKTLSVLGHRLFYLYVKKLEFNTSVIIPLSNVNFPIEINVQDWLEYFPDDKRAHQSLKRACENASGAQIFINDLPYALFYEAKYVKREGRVLLQLSDNIYDSCF